MDVSGDVCLKILGYLTVKEIENFIVSLEQIKPPQKTIDDLKTMCYSRLYSGKFTIYSNLNSGGSSVFDTKLTLTEFMTKMKESSQLGNDDYMFRTTRPQYIEFTFIRELHDFVNFVNDLNNFRKVFEGINDPLLAYFNGVYQYGLHVDGNCVEVESPNSFLTAILKLLVAISQTNVHGKHNFCAKFTKITIKSTDIGQYYTSQWSQLFCRFSHVDYLDLSSNLIKLDSYIYDLSGSNDILGSNVQWPPYLKILHLNNNYISYLSKDFIRRLPKTLEKLDVSNNSLTTVGVPPSESSSSNNFNNFDINQELPHLHSLLLNKNHRLWYISPEIFTNSNTLKIVSIYQCNLDSENLSRLISTAKNCNFQIII